MTMSLVVPLLQSADISTGLIFVLVKINFFNFVFWFVVPFQLIITVHEACFSPV
jgi:hypothetical protein